MKRLSLFIALLATTVAGAQTNQSYTVRYTPSTAVFTGSTNVTVSPDGYNIFASTNVTLPFNQWTFAGSVPAETIQSNSSNYVATTSASFTVALNPPVFVAMTYSNGLGTSPFSQAAGLQAYPTPPKPTSISSP